MRQKFRRSGSTKLTYKQRMKLPNEAFADRENRAYPVPTVHELQEVNAANPSESGPRHARNALARVAQHGTPKQKKEVCETVEKRYPSVHEGSCEME